MPLKECHKVQGPLDSTKDRHFKDVCEYPWSLEKPAVPRARRLFRDTKTQAGKDHI